MQFVYFHYTILSTHVQLSRHAWELYIYTVPLCNFINRKKNVFFRTFSFFNCKPKHEAASCRYCQGCNGSGGGWAVDIPHRHLLQISPARHVRITQQHSALTHYFQKYISQNVRNYAKSLMKILHVGLCITTECQQRYKIRYPERVFLRKKISLAVKFFFGDIIRERISIFMGQTYPN